MNTRNDVKLFDLWEGKYPRNRGDRFRTNQVFRCRTCRTLFNEGFNGGYPGYGLRAICPYHKCHWHQLIEGKLELFDDWRLPLIVRMTLWMEIVCIRLITAFWARNDIIGKPDFNQVEKVFGVSVPRVRR